MRHEPLLHHRDDGPIRWASLAAAIAAIGAVGIAIGLGLPLLSVILEKRGISPSLIGFNSAVAGLASIAAAPLATRIARRLGVAATMVWALAISAIGAMGFYFAEAFWMWFPLRVLFHGAITIVFILSEFWINDAAPPHRRGLVLGIYGTVLSLGFAAGPWIFSVVGSEGPAPFVIGALLVLSAALPILFAGRDAPVIGAVSDRPFLRFMFLVPTATAAVFVFGAVEAGGLALFPIYSNQLGFGETDGARLLTVIGLGNVLFQIPIGLYADRIRDRRPLLVLFAIVGLVGSLMLPVVSSSWWTMAAVLFVWGGVVSGLYTVGLTHLGATLRGGDLASANAAFVFCYALGTLVGPQAIGIAMDLEGPDGFAFSLAFFFALYVTLSLARLAFGPKRA